ncbi:hypothetical protein AB0D57_08015 [Streptomyces sp. NPDC048275]|uniref:hypothetical protein n=1 Tax=Streptomyces sp. NPDC048275 TaxID=3155629 RepID=UPI0033EA961B
MNAARMASSPADPAPRASVAPHRRLADAASFDKVVGDARQVAAVYFYLQLDSLVCCAHQVAADFFARPQLYTDLGEQRLAPRLAELHARAGSDERIPSQAQRDAIYRAVFGRSAAEEADAAPVQGDFQRLSTDLIAAVSAYAERVFDSGEAMLRERVRTSHRPLRDYLTGLSGDSLDWAAGEALASIARDRAYPILRNPGICAVFGISTPPVADWPYLPDSNADKLVEEITKQLAGTGPTAHPVLTREAISNRQRAALRGAEALIAVLDFTDDGSEEQLTALITRSYTWGAALGALAPATGTASRAPLPLSPER